LPDGEVGDRRYWIDGIAYRVFNGHPEIETLRRPAPDANGVESWRPLGSSVLTTNFVLRLGELHIEQEISRQDFERWIADDITRIEQTVDQLLQRESVSVDEIDSVFLTGGSSFIPAVRSVFETRFGADRLADGEHFQSVAFGLALIGLEDDVGPWLVQSPSS
ncbi:MAG TPA: Hsp70 family protein, partial [Stellaceae bacterium]|nr:Hsp70 family protein [Stellaceae bacterium]